MNRAFYRPIFWPLVLVAVGVLWLLINFNVIAMGNLAILVRFWPVLLIGLGLDVIFRRRWPWLSNLITLGIVTLGVGLVLLAPRLGYAAASPIWFYSVPWMWGKELGSGKVITETRPVSDFDAVSFNSLGELVIQLGPTESLRIEGEDNVLREIRTEVRNGTLQIGDVHSDAWLRVQPTKPIRFVLTVKHLNDLKLSGVGDVIVKALETDRLQTTLSGTGGLSFENVSANDLTFRLSGAGNVDATGTASRLETQVSGLGSFKGGDLQSANATVTISGTGSATVWATDYLDARISGLGSVQYYGSPDVSQAISGLGSIRQLGDK